MNIINYRNSKSVKANIPFQGNRILIGRYFKGNFPYNAKRIIKSGFSAGINL